MRLIDQFYKPEGIDRYTFVFDEVDPLTGLNTMLALSEDGYGFSQWTEGLYDPDGENAHLGQRVLFHELGELVTDRFFSRLGYQRNATIAWWQASRQRLNGRNCLMRH